MRGISRAIEFIFGMGKLEWLGYNLVTSGRMMIDSIVWAQRDRHTDSHVAIANAAPAHCVGRRKSLVEL